MDEPSGLRERKKQRTHQAISDAAIALFLDRGFDAVSVRDVAEAAEVSKRTVFKYFPTKEDLVLHRVADHEDESARVVRYREPGQSPLDALLAHFVAGLWNGDAITGISDNPQVRQVYELITGTPALAERLLRYAARGEAALTTALAEVDFDPIRPALTAAAIIAVQRTLSETNQRLITSGTRAAARLPDAITEAERAFALLRDGFGSTYG
ncbi:MAG TPA: TetR family transcriptional regulator [Pseudonocardiaceae bacterium]|jgi:AcrR family transcriptional regulator|nr:TetR family transcriptional regulator [Pseudonocardiaceae bacterium]